jgi:molybdenum cofactor cytidylyltransferase
VRLAAIVLAAGAGSRFGGGKMNAAFRGEPLVHHAVRAARAAPVERVIVVARPEVDVGDWRGAPEVVRVRIESDAISASLKAGIAAAEGFDGAFVFLGDMPLVPHDLAGRLTSILGDSIAAVPRHAGKNGHPVLFSAQAFPALTALEGDQGAGAMLKSRRDIAFDECPVATIFLDVDRAEDIGRLEGENPS